MKANFYLLITCFVFLINLSSEAQELSFIIIRDAPHGDGKEVEKWLRSDDGSIRLYCAGYDSTGRFIDNVSVLWTVSLDNGNLIISPPENSDSLLVLNEGPALRIDNVRAYHSDLNLQDTTGVLYLIDNSLHSIQIRTAPDGGGTEVTTVTMTTDDSFNLYAAGYDSSDNFICNQIVDWSLIGTLDGQPVTDTVFTFSPMIAPTSGVIVATVDNMSDATGVFIVEEPTSIAQNQTPLKYELKNAYPNSFNPTTRIEFTLPGPEFVTLTVYNILGKEIAALVNGELRAGNHAYEFDGSGLASGVYIYRILAGEFRDVKKMILLR